MAREQGRGSGGFFRGQTSTVTPPPAPCSNLTAVQSFASQYQTLITELTNNGSFTQWLQDHAQELTYIQNADNIALIDSNCTAFFSGLASARALDQTALLQKRQYSENAQNRVNQLLAALGIRPSGNHGDSHEH